jgi:AcrR family transcriptional regulator
VPADPAPEVASLREEHRLATRRRVVAAARKVFIKKGYTKATIEDIVVAANVSRATLYLHFNSKLQVLGAATEKMAAESHESARQLATVLIEGDRDDLRTCIESAVGWYERNRPMALAALEAQLSLDRPGRRLTAYLECIEPWVATWPPERQAEARMRFELCRLQLFHYMWGNSTTLFVGQDVPIDLFTEMWWNTLKAPLLG